MKIKLCLLLVLILFALNAVASNITPRFTTSDPIVNDIDGALLEDVYWGYLSVPENWANPDGDTLRLAVAILKAKPGNRENLPVLAIEGGPGAGTIEGFMFWVNHPLRATGDIILMDSRGTGHSRPRLCPELGNDILRILAKDQDTDANSQAKVDVAMTCREDMIARGIDPKQYNIANIAKDFHALREQLGYKKWNLYAVSYGTYVAQVYASKFPLEIRSIVLDSPISDITKYYTQNTSNFAAGLKKIFDGCAKDPQCNERFQNLEQVFYETVASLEKNPITVEIDKSIVKGGTFTYNAEDFKIAIHQAMYQKYLVQMMPMLIYQFYHRNEETLSALVAAFSGALGLDYGVYFSVISNEALPLNAPEVYNIDAERYSDFKGRLSFYHSDFAVRDAWNSNKKDSLTIYKPDHRQITAPVLIFTGNFDPITPASNGKELADLLLNARIVNRLSYGHASSYTLSAMSAVAGFISSPSDTLKLSIVKQFDDVVYISDVKVNSGIYKFSSSLNNFEVLLLIPLIIAMIVLLIGVVIYLYRAFKTRYIPRGQRVNMLLVVLSSLTGIVLVAGFVIALSDVADINYYILAFGLPEKYSYLYTILSIFIALTTITTLLYFMNFRRAKDRSIAFTITFSNILVVIYFYYWGILSF